MKAFRFLLCLLVAPSVFAETREDTRSVIVEEIAIPSYAVGLTPSSYLVAPSIEYVYCRNETNSIRYRADGTDPTATDDSILIKADEAISIARADIEDIRFIRTAATSPAYLTCDYRR